MTPSPSAPPPGPCRDPRKEAATPAQAARPWRGRALLPLVPGEEETRPSATRWATFNELPLRQARGGPPAPAGAGSLPAPAGPFGRPHPALGGDAERAKAREMRAPPGAELRKGLRVTARGAAPASGPRRTASGVPALGRVGAGGRPSRPPVSPGSAGAKCSWPRRSARGALLHGLGTRRSSASPRSAPSGPARVSPSDGSVDVLPRRAARGRPPRSAAPTTQRHQGLGAQDDSGAPLSSARVLQRAGPAAPTRAPPRVGRRRPSCRAGPLLAAAQRGGPTCPARAALTRAAALEQRPPHRSSWMVRTWHMPGQVGPPCAWERTRLVRLGEHDRPRRSGA